MILFIVALSFYKIENRSIYLLIEYFSNFDRPIINIFKLAKSYITDCQLNLIK